MRSRSLGVVPFKLWYPAVGWKQARRAPSSVTLCQGDNFNCHTAQTSKYLIKTRMMMMLTLTYIPTTTNYKNSFTNCIQRPRGMRSPRALGNVH